MPRKAPFRKRLEEYLARLAGIEEGSRTTYGKVLEGTWKAMPIAGISQGRSPSTWTLEEIQAIIDVRKTREDGIPRANTSLRGEIDTLNRFLKFCGNYRLDQALVFREVRKPPNTKAYRRWKSLEDIIHLRVGARRLGDDIALMTIQLALDAYLRVGEISRLELRDLTGTSIQVRHGKGRKDREVSITERTRLDLEEFITGARMRILRGCSSPFLLVHNRKAKPRPYRAESLSEHLRILGKSLNPPMAVSPHDLRRSGAQLTYISNPTDKTVRNLQSALGHSTAEQTREYIGADVVDQHETLRLRDEYLAKLYPEEFSQHH